VGSQCSRPGPPKGIRRTATGTGEPSDHTTGCVGGHVPRGGERPCRATRESVLRHHRVHFCVARAALPEHSGRAPFRARSRPERTATAAHSCSRDSPNTRKSSM
jgi:hypothetical protein